MKDGTDFPDLLREAPKGGVVGRAEHQGMILLPLRVWHWRCFVTDKPTYEQLHQMLLENSNNDGQAYFHLLPRKVSQ
jgi:hypothetical protein